MISTLVTQEIAGVEDEAKRQRLIRLVSPFRELQVTAEATALAEEYLRYGIFKQRHFADALHAAIASTHGVPFVASWNFKHLVRVETRRQVSLVNSLLGWGSLEIVAPPEV